MQPPRRRSGRLSLPAAIWTCASSAPHDRRERLEDASRGPRGMPQELLGFRPRIAALIGSASAQSRDLLLASYLVRCVRPQYAATPEGDARNADACRTNDSWC